MKRVLVSWSTGKDSAWMVHMLRETRAWEIGALLTTVNQEAERVAMHAVRIELLRAQAAALGVPVWMVPIPYPCPNEIYEARMLEAVARARREGFDAVAFGDLFLEDVRRYREERLQNSGLEPIFPLWQQPTAALARQMVAAGLKAKVTCVDPRVLDRSFIGRDFNARFLEELPPAIDPCGERGEFHTFACAGPMFKQPIAVDVGEIVERDGFVFADLLVPSRA